MAFVFINYSPHVVEYKHYSCNLQQYCFSKGDVM